MPGTLIEWVAAIIGTLGLGSGGGAVGYVRRVNTKAESAQDIAERVERRQVGDPEDPNSEGVLQTVHRIEEQQGDFRGEFEEFRQETREAHREVKEAVEELADE